MRNRLLSLFLMLTIALALTGCKPDPNVQFIHGTWYHSDAHLGSVVGELGQETYWTFDRGRSSSLPAAL
jgi:hypothetical protein